MRYPIAIERGTETAAYGVVVPDLPGCFYGEQDSSMNMLLPEVRASP
jgi:HicB_like antitoxin of bacterial toxin-antitoxin system